MTATRTDVADILAKSDLPAELTAFVTRVEGVRVVNGMLLAGGDGVVTGAVVLAGLQRPRLAGVGHP